MTPCGYGQQMLYNSAVKPKNGISATNSEMSLFFQRYLWQDLIGAFKWKIPDHWSYDYLTYSIFMYGFVAVINTDKFGVIPQICSLKGYNIYYEPTRAVITNHLLHGIKEPVIGKQCTLIRLNADYSGMWDLVTYYADLLASMCSAVGVNIINSKLAFIFFGNNKAQGETLKKIYDDISAGKPAVFADKAVLNPDGTPAWTFFDSNVSQHYILDKLLVDMDKIINQFRTRCGIANANMEKKEREIVDEVNSNNDATAIAPESRLDRLKKGVKETVEMFHVKLSVDWRYKPNEQSTDINTDNNVGKSAGNERNGNTRRG